MRHTLYFKGLEKTEAIENYLDKRLKNLGKLVNDNAARATVELGKTTAHHKSGNVFRAEINLHSAGKEFYAAVEKDDLYAAIDEMRDEITREIAKFKGKSETMFRRGARAVKNIIKGLDPRGLKNWRKFRPWKRR
ncbi:MAG TPA: ribosome-associated translation inhibitor RaiA [Candidatus Paceibacterota bacterium]